jgi:hypothetical protein
MTMTAWTTLTIRHGSLRKTHLFLSFPSVCPEPVLVK